MMHVVDTDVCIDVLRGHPRAVDLLESLEGSAPLAVAAITAHELWQGAARAKDRSAAERGVDRFLTAFDVLPYDSLVARVGGRIAADLARAGKSIGDLDTMIAATALVAKATLVTRNVRHFRRVPGLDVRAL